MSFTLVNRPGGLAGLAALGLGAVLALAAPAGASEPGPYDDESAPSTAARATSGVTSSRRRGRASLRGAHLQRAHARSCARPTAAPSYGGPVYGRSAYLGPVYGRVVYARSRTTTTTTSAAS